MDQVILLDTHALVWWVLEPSRFSRAATRAMKHARRRLLADISLREVAMLAAAQRLALDDDPAGWLKRTLESCEVEVVAITPAIAARSTRIAQRFHDDPADQLIAATAIELDVPLLTADERLRASPALRTIW